jgi:hypothetical protein
MSYNAEHFPPEQVSAANLELDGLIQEQNHLLDFLREFLMATNGVDQLANCYCFVELTVKVRLNMEVANDLLPKLQEDYRFKTSINLIYRSIIDDLISMFYLSGFVLKDDAKQIPLSNELAILHKEFLSSSTKGIDADNAHLEYIHEMLNESPPQISDFRQGIIAENPELFENGMMKNNKTLRETSNPIFQELLKDTNGAGFITEAKKLDFIAEREPNLAQALTGLFKYLSRYQHYSPKMHEFVLSDADLDIQTYKKCLVQVLHMVDVLLQFIVLNDPQYFISYFKEMMAVMSVVNGNHKEI